MKKPLITEIENVETNRVLSAMSKAKLALNIVMVAILGFGFPFMIHYAAGLQTLQYIALGIYVVTYIVAYASVHSKYARLLDTAKLNDRIRHEEKVRNIERDRHDLEKEIERLKLELEHASNQSKNMQ